MFQVNWQNLEHNNMTQLQAVVDGETFPNQPIVFDFTTSAGTNRIYDQYIACKRLLSGDGSTSFTAFSGGQMLVPIMLSEHFPSVKYQAEKRTGLLTIRVRFRAPTGQSLNFYTFAVSSTTLGLARDGTVIL